MKKNVENHSAVLQKVEGALKLWCQRLTEDEAEPYSLLAMDQCITTGSPNRPDEWMLQDTGILLKPPGGNAMMVASIPSILRKHSEDHETIYCKRLRDRNIYVMRIGTPQKTLFYFIALSLMNKVSHSRYSLRVSVWNLWRII